MYQELLPQHSILYSRMISFRFYLTLEIWDVQSQPQNSILKWGSTSTCVGYTHGHVHRILPLTLMHLTETDLDSFPSVRLNCTWKGGWGGTSVPSVTMENPRPFSSHTQRALQSTARWGRWLLCKALNCEVCIAWLKYIHCLVYQHLLR